MKTNVMTKTRVVAMASLVAAMLAAGCELVVDFDRTKIDAGGATDGSVNDVTTDTSGDQQTADTGPDTTAETGGETGTDGGTDSPADRAADAPAEAAQEAAAEAGPEASTDAGQEAEAASPANLTIGVASSGAFGNVDVGGTPVDLLVTVTNTGGTASSAVTTSVTGSAAVTIVAGQDNCNGNTVAANNGTCTFKVRFTPTVDGALSGVLAKATATTGGAPTGALSGTGKGLVYTALPADFGTVTVASNGTPQTMTVKNQASATSGTITCGFSGTNSGDFLIVGGQDNCTGQTLGTGATCTVQINFHPTATGSRVAIFNAATSSGIGGTAAAQVTGTGN